MTQDLYNDLAQALEELSPQEQVLYGTLGYGATPSDYSVIEPTRIHMYRVVLEDGTYQEILHKGNASPTPGMRVKIRFDEVGVPYIDGVDANWASQNSAATSGNYDVSLHNHSRGSGMEFPLDLRLVEQFYLELRNSMIVYIRPGIYFYQGVTKYWAGGTIDLTAQIPPTPGGYRWSVIAFDPVLEQLALVNGVELLWLSESIGPERLPEVAVLAEEKVPIHAVQLKYGMTVIPDQQVHSMMDMLATTTLPSSQGGMWVNPVADARSIPAGNQQHAIQQTSATGAALTVAGEYWVDDDITIEDGGTLIIDDGGQVTVR